MKPTRLHRIFKVLNKIRDPFGEKERHEEEIKIHFALERAKNRVKILQKALTNGKQIHKQLEHERKQVANISKQLPLGDNLWFGVFFIWYVGTITFLIIFYLYLAPILTEWWNLPENWYLQRHRPLAASTWSFLQFFTSSFYIVILALPIVFLWYIQQKLLRWHARFLIRSTIFITTFIIFLTVCILFRLIQLPLL